MTITLTDTATIKRQHLLQALHQITPAAPRTTSLPVLTGVRITIGDGRAAISATDLDIAVTTHVPAAGTLDAVVPARLLQKLAQQTVGDIALQPGDGEVLLRWGRTTAQLRTLPVDEWPTFKPIDGEPVKLQADDLDRIRRIANFASGDDARPILTGIRLGARELVATDSYRLAIATWTDPIADKDPAGDVLFPARAARFLPQLLASEHATLTIADHSILLEAGELEINTVRIDGAFPPYERLLPVDPPTRYTFNRAALTAAIRAAAVLCGDATPVRITVDGDKASIVGMTQDVGQVDTELDVTVGGRPLDTTAAFNPRYLLDVVTTCHRETLTLELVDALKPALVREDPYTLLLMPVRVS